MPQVLKDDVRSRIRAAALRAFAVHGYAGATMAGVAAEAGMAPANLYRYYRNKQELYDAVVPDEVVDTLEQVVGRRVEDFASLVKRDGTTTDVADEMMRFWLQYRLESVVILSGAAGTRHADVVARINSLSVEALVNALPAGTVAAGDVDLFESIWTNTSRTIARILLHNETEADLRATITSFWRYQIAGLTALLRHLADRRPRS
ncbi:TetR/AcrR family transcriptional regulator [Kribbella sp. NPDC049227]|uniref:TetR/AcrR family transcriptional regulator n=1 Tax=Kribbella sp. NPDC049227 TaxID=3364113 RepID=UPI00371FB4D7